MDQDRAADQTPAPTPAPALTPGQEVGAKLKATRISRGYSLESVCQHTRIPRKFLEALETGRFDDLPAPVYLRSFLTGYCEYLELDLRPLWDKLHPAPAAPADAAATASPAPTASRAPSGDASAAPAPSASLRKGHGGSRAATPVPAKAPPAHAPMPTAPRASPYLDALASAMGGVTLSLALALALVWWVARGHGAPPASEESLRPQALLPVRPAVEQKLTILSRDEAWVGVKADGVLVFAGRVPKNARQEWQAHKVILLRSSAPENLALTLNGAPYRLQRADETGDYRIVSQ